MRRLLLTAFALAAVGCGLFLSSGSSTGQLIQAIVADTRHGGGSNFTTNCTESGNFLNTKVGGQGHGMSTTIAAYYDTMICGMVTDGNFSTLDALYILTAPTTPIAKYNLTATATTYDLVEQGTGTFTANSDYQGNGSTGYLDTGLNPNTAGGNYTATSASIGSYVLNNVGSVETVSIGSVNASGNGVAQLLPYDQFGPQAVGYLNFLTPSAETGATNSSGCLAMATDGSHQQLQLHSSAGDFFPTQGVPVSPAVPAQNFYIDARNNAGTADIFGTYKIGAAWIAGQVDLITHPAAMCSRINAFMTSQGVNAY
jgi:hypothetical protein